MCEFTIFKCEIEILQTLNENSLAVRCIVEIFYKHVVS